jgi:hypothetical protein
MPEEGHLPTERADRKMKSCETLPKTLPGTVCVQWLRCGRKNCRCARGEYHGPYHYRLWRENGRRRKAYVMPQELEQVRAQCQARRQNRREVQGWWDAWRQLLAAVREHEPT